MNRSAVVQITLGFVLGVLSLFLALHLQEDPPPLPKFPAVLKREDLRELEDGVRRQGVALDELSREVRKLLEELSALSRAPEDSEPPAVELPAADELSQTLRHAALREVYGGAYEGFSDMWILNRALDSPDPYLKTFASSMLNRM